MILSNFWSTNHTRRWSITIISILQRSCLQIISVTKKITFFFKNSLFIFIGTQFTGFYMTRKRIPNELEVTATFQHYYKRFVKRFWLVFDAFVEAFFPKLQRLKSFLKTTRENTVLFNNTFYKSLQTNQFRIWNRMSAI